MDNGLADHRAKAGHPVRQPFRDTAAVQPKIGGAGFSSHPAQAPRIACHTRSGVAGMSMWRMPYSDSASMSAFMTEGRAPAQPASPQPLAPSGFVVAGTEWKS